MSHRPREVSRRRTTHRATGLEGARRAPSEHPRRASPRAVRARSGTRRTADGGGRGRLSRLLEEPDHRRDACALLVRLAEDCGLRARIDAMFRRRQDQRLGEARRAPRRVARTARRLDPGRRQERGARRSRRARPDGGLCQSRPQRRLDRATRASGSATSSTSASAVPISGRSWPTRRSGTTATAASPSGSSRTSTARTSSKRSAISTPRRRSSSCRRRPSRRWKR